MREIIAKMVIDDTSYQRAGSVSSAPKAKPVEAKKTETTTNTNDKKYSYEFVSN